MLKAQRMENEEQTGVGGLWIDRRADFRARCVLVVGVFLLGVSLCGLVAGGAGAASAATGNFDAAMESKI